MAKLDPVRVQIVAAALAPVPGDWEALAAFDKAAYRATARKVLTALDEHDRHVRGSRIAAGHARSRLAGKVRSGVGHPRLPEDVAQKIRDMIAEKNTNAVIRNALGVGTFAITRIRREMDNVSAGSATLGHSEPGDIQIQEPERRLA